jgi:RNA-dependent RNA polymerase
VTPTLIRYSEAKEEESNRVVRRFKTSLENFIRISFVNEECEKGYYFSAKSERQNYLLGYIHLVMSHGFMLGDLRFQFLAYSNS